MDWISGDAIRGVAYLPPGRDGCAEATWFGCFFWLGLDWFLFGLNWIGFGLDDDMG